MLRKRKSVSRLRYFVSYRLENGKEDWEGFAWREQAIRFWENLPHDTVESAVQHMKSDGNLETIEDD